MDNLEAEENLRNSKIIPVDTPLKSSAENESEAGII